MSIEFKIAITIAFEADTEMLCFEGIGIQHAARGGCPKPDRIGHAALERDTMMGNSRRQVEHVTGI
jgi:hypothetical protein